MVVQPREEYPLFVYREPPVRAEARHACGQGVAANASGAYGMMIILDDMFSVLMLKV
jgi:hypothetical protein